MFARLLPLILIAPLFASAQSLPEITRFDGVYERSSFAGTEEIGGVQKPADDAIGSLVNVSCPQTLHVKANAAASKSSERIIAYAGQPITSPLDSQYKIYDMNESYSSCKGYGVIACLASKTVLDDYVKSKYKSNEYTVSNEHKSNHNVGRAVSISKTNNGLVLKSSFATANYGSSGYYIALRGKFTCQYNKIQ